MITCFRCGEQNPYDSKYCSNCGNQLDAEKETKKVHYYNETPMITCPSCGAQGEQNFSRHIQLISKVQLNKSIIEVKCKRCGYVSVLRP